jgi:hypothetical protein
MDDTIEIGSFTDYFQATLAKEILDSNEIHCIITGVNLSIIDITTETKIKLIINKNDLDKAEELLASFFS